MNSRMDTLSPKGLSGRYRVPMEGELLGFMAVLSIAGAMLGALWAERIWRTPDGHSVLLPTNPSAGSHAVLWEVGPGLPTLAERVQHLQSVAQVLFLPVGADCPEGVRRLVSDRPEVEAVLAAAEARSFFGPVRVVVEGLDALEPSGKGESPTAVLEHLLEGATTGVTLVIRDGDARPEGPWKADPTC